MKEFRIIKKKYNVRCQECQTLYIIEMKHNIKPNFNNKKCWKCGKSRKMKIEKVWRKTKEGV